MATLDLDNILDDDELTLFDISGGNQENDDSEESEEKDKEETTESNQEDDSESVGSEIEDNQGEENADTGDSDSSSPKFFSSIAEAIAEEGILPNLDAKKIKTPEDLRNAIEEHIKSEFDERQRRIDEALNNNVEPSVIRQYEGTLNYLNNITDELLREESEKGEDLRKRIIYQDYINRGFSKERATKAVNKAVEQGNDIEDAIEALESNKEFFTNAYNGELQRAKDIKAQEEEENKKQASALKDTIFNDKKFFGEIELDNKTKQRVYDSITKPIYKDPKTGELFTEVQKYEKDNKNDFLAKVALVYTLTDGFKDLNGLAKGKVKKEIKKGFKELERKINSSSRDSYGNLTFTSGVSYDEETGKGIKFAF